MAIESGTATSLSRSHPLDRLSLYRPNQLPFGLLHLNVTQSLQIKLHRGRYDAFYRLLSIAESLEVRLTVIPLMTRFIRYLRMMQSSQFVVHVHLEYLTGLWWSSTYRMTQNVTVQSDCKIGKNWNTGLCGLCWSGRSLCVEIYRETLWLHVKIFAPANYT